MMEKRTCAVCGSMRVRVNARKSACAESATTMRGAMRGEARAPL